MGIWERITGIPKKIFKKEKYAVHDTCSFCGEVVYLPFTCPYCGKKYCGAHHLPFNHDCKNIADWKKSRAPFKKS